MKYLICLFLLTLFSCNDTSQTHILEEKKIEGVWHEIEKKGQIMGSANYNYQFVNDSFKVKINISTDAIQVGDTCSKYEWSEYAAGQFFLNNNRIYFNGVYTDSLYNKISVGCYHVGPYKAEYKYSFINDTLLFELEDPIYPDQIRLVKVVE